MSKLIVVGCGSKKAEKPKKAKNLYTSTYFELKKEYAEQSSYDWKILSAKHGLINPEKKIEPYDTKIEDRKPEITGIKDYEEIEVLAGKNYRKHLNNETNAKIINKFEETSGIGEQMKLLKEETQ